jgi:hypothetical protein
LVATASTLLLAAGASAATFRGVVVHDNPRAHSFVVAGRGGRMRAVHARRLPALGHKVTVIARRLRNQTWVARHVRVGQSAKRVRIRGTVSFVDARHGVFVLSARGASVVIHRHNVLRHSVGLASDSRVKVGDDVTVEGTLDDDAVDAIKVKEDGEHDSTIHVAGTVKSIETTARTLSISADDDDELAATITVDVPDTFDLSVFKAGESVELKVSANADGTFTLVASSDDSGAEHADSSSEMQGDDHADGSGSGSECSAGTMKADGDCSGSRSGS